MSLPRFARLRIVVVASGSALVALASIVSMVFADSTGGPFPR